MRDAGADTLAGQDAADLPAAASAAYRWGVCYVAEGAQLGGAVLYQRLADRLAPHPLRLPRGAEGGPGPAWRAFMQALRAHGGRGRRRLCRRLRRLRPHPRAGGPLKSFR